jgi:hypothetical protein
MNPLLDPHVRGPRDASFTQDRQCTHYETFRRVRVTTVAVEKKCVIYSECVYVSLVIQHAKYMRNIILSPVACLSLPHFPTLSHKRHGITEKGN